MASLALAAGTSPAAFVEAAITLSGTAANLNFNAGDILTFQSTVTGTGMTLPEAKVRVVLSRS